MSSKAKRSMHLLRGIGAHINNIPAGHPASRQRPPTEMAGDWLRGSSEAEGTWERKGEGVITCSFYI